MSEFYERYSTLRNKKGLRDSEVADSVGISRSSFTLWKKDRSLTPSAKNLQKIAEFFGTTSEYLLTGKEAEPIEVPQQIIELADLIMAMRKNPKLTKVANSLADLDDDALFVVETFIESYKAKM